MDTMSPLLTVLLVVFAISTIDRNRMMRISREMAHLYCFSLLTVNTLSGTGPTTPISIDSTPELLGGFEWFIKADDDTFVVTENMLGFTRYYDPSYPHYLGHIMRHRWKTENVIFNSGTCYLLSRKSIEKVGRYLVHLPTIDPPPRKERCVDRWGSGEDPETATCLMGVGIRPGNSLDHELRERFLSFRPEDHHKMKRLDTDHWRYRPEGVADGENCCSPYPVSMHNYKKIVEAERLWPLLMTEYNQPKDWDTIILPPRPRQMLYSKSAVDWEIDEWLNIKNPPRGQRLYKGEGREWICHDCQHGDEYLTEWWDGMLHGHRSDGGHKSDVVF